MTVAHAGKVGDPDAKAQHVDLYRKLLIRRDLLAHALEGPAYCPYIGDGDIALELYADRLILGADLDPERVATAAARLPRADVRVADCEGPYPFADRTEPVAVADLDAYSNPYLAFAAFWSTAPRAGRVVIFGTDGMRLASRQSRTRMIGALPAGRLLEAADLAEKRAAYNGHWPRLVRPYLEATLAPWRILEERKYQRNHMIYWGVVAGPAAGKSHAPGWRKPGELKRQTSAHYRAQVAARVARRTARLRPLTKAERLAALEAGGWVCWICGEPIDRELRHPDRRSPSVDHRLAVALGGTNDPANLAPAHLGCNGRKRDSLSLEAGKAGPLGPPAAPVDEDVAAVEGALREAALSGNVPAALAWLEARAPDRWGRGPGSPRRMTGPEMDEALGFDPPEPRPG